MATTEEDYKNLLLGLIEAPAPEGVPQVKDAQVAANARALMSGEVPEGVDMQALLQNLIAMDADRNAGVKAINDQMAALSTEQGVIAGRVTESISKLMESRQATLAATEEQIEGQGAINETTLNRTFELDAELQDTIDYRDSQRELIDGELNSTFEQMLRDYETVEENDNLNILSVIQNPIQAANLALAAKDAKQRLLTNKDKIAVLDTQNQLQTRMTQQKFDSYNVEKTLMQMQNIDLYARQNAINTALTKLSAKNANYTEVLGDLKEYYGIGGAQLQNLETQVRLMAEQGRLNANTFDAALKAEQYKLSKLQFDEAKKLAEQNEGTLALFDAKFKEIGKQVGIPELDSFAAWQAMEDGNLVTDAMRFTVQQTFMSGTLGAASVWNAENPTQAFNTTVNQFPGTLPDKMVEFLVTLDSRNLGGGQVNKTAAYAEDPEKARNEAIRNFRTAVTLDVEPAIKQKLFVLQSPHNMDLERIPGFPVELIPEFKNMRLDTTSFDAFALSAANQLLKGNTTNDDISMYAKYMATLSTYHRDMWNRETGFGLQHIRTQKFRNPITGQAGDATNPNDWKTYLTKMKVQSDAVKANVVPSISAGINVFRGRN